MNPFVKIDREKNGNYLKLLVAVSKLSGLFSDNAIPYINYRVIENIFCKSFNANNLSRSDTAFDAQIKHLGIGIKTFICEKNNRTEKIAEFNSLAHQIVTFKDNKTLAIKLAQFRNERIDFAKRLYNIENALYHIVARRNKELILFETDYDKINIENIQAIKRETTSLQFEDGKNFYSFNFSKNTLFRRFIIPQTAYKLPIEIVQNPYDLLLEFFENKKTLQISTYNLIRGINYIILPLYGIKNKQKFVFEKSGLNQWNANGRARDVGEVYIPIPIDIHKLFPNFFPSRDTPFNLQTPTGETLPAKICQDNSKALMTNPNNALADWLLRKVLNLKKGTLATIDKMNILGFDSVIIKKENNKKYTIDKAKLGSYEKFINPTNF